MAKQDTPTTLVRRHVTASLPHSLHTSHHQHSCSLRHFKAATDLNKSNTKDKTAVLNLFPISKQLGHNSRRGVEGSITDHDTI